MLDWLDRIAELVAEHGAVARAVIVEATAPTPRAVGSAVVVAGEHVEGRIGRGELEATVVRAAAGCTAGYVSDATGPRWPRQVRSFGSGAVMGKPTGGVISVLIEVYGAAEIAALADMNWRGDRRNRLLARVMKSGDPPLVITSSAEMKSLPPHLVDAVGRFGADAVRRLVMVPSSQDRPCWVVERLGRATVPFYVYGTGLIARAVVRTLVELPFDLHWIDTDPAHFPPDAQERAERVVAGEPARVAADAPPGAFHAVMTQAHELDCRICRELLRSGTFGYLGVVGAPLKRARIEERLAAEGIVTEAMKRMSCPIGLSEINSKDPAVIAISVAAEALIALQRRDGAQPKGSKR